VELNRRKKKHNVVENEMKVAAGECSSDAELTASIFISLHHLPTLPPN